MPTAADVARALSQGEGQLLDIRESYEANTAPVAAAIRIPLGLLLADPEALPRRERFFVLDHDGSRVRFATRYLREHGIDAVGVEGGALALLRASAPGPA